MSEPGSETTSFRIQRRDASHSIVTVAASVFREVECKIMGERTSNREEGIPTRCNNIDDLLSVPDVDY